MEFKSINTFGAGEEITSFFIIKGINLKTSSNNKKYLDLELADKTGEINAKLWDISDDKVELYKSGDVVKVKGTVTVWQNQQQLKITLMRPKNDEDEIKMDDLIPSAPIPSHEMMMELKDFIRKINNPDIKKIVDHFVDINSEKLNIYPAAKRNHHAIRSGLLYHILRMLRTAEGLCDVYQNLNKDLLFAGVILHDMEKINEMNADEFGIVSDYTIDGQLLGHLIMGVKKIDEAAKLLHVDSDISLILQHMILAHHYEPEYGSPKKPMIPEAEMLHYLDMIDARIYDMEKALSATEDGQFSEGIQSMERRRFLKVNIR